MTANYLVDSSIWIALERKTPSVVAVIQPLLDTNEVCIADVIVAELLRGTRTRRDYRILQRLLADFIHLQTTWYKVADLAFAVARTGMHPPLLDVYIAQCALEHRKILVTQDRHFQQIARCTPLEVVLL